MVVCISWLHSRLCVCGCDGDVVCVGHDLNRCTGWWYVCSVNVEKVLVKGRHLVERQLSGCVVSICCVGFASLNVVCDELNDCAWNVCL